MFQRLNRWYGKKTVFGLLAIFLVIFSFGIFSGDNEAETIPEDNERVVGVRVSTAGEIAGQTSLSLLGSVRAANEVALTTERSGTVTRVYTTLGAKVFAGQTILELSNASERAALLQAEGAYEAALAASAQSGVSLDEAKTSRDAVVLSIESSLTNSYSVMSDIIFNTVDAFYSNPDSGIIGVRINSRGQAEYLNSERKDFQTILLAGSPSLSSTETDEILQSLEASISIARRLLALLDTFIILASDESNLNAFTEIEINSLRDSLATARTRLLADINTLESKKTSLASADDAIARASISASGGNSSVADAQVKQALGALRAAEANYAKTIIRSPIAGSINKLDIKVGQFVGANLVVAEVANNQALEIVTYVSDSELGLLKLGDTLTLGELGTGTVIAIAPAVDQISKKTEVRLTTEAGVVKSGETVRLSKSVTNTNAGSDALVTIPLTAVKFEGTNGSILQVESDVLVKKDIEIRTIRGSSVQVTTGLGTNDEFVVDVRGLSAGTKVTVIQN